LLLITEFFQLSLNVNFQFRILFFPTAQLINLPISLNLGRKIRRSHWKTVDVVSKGSYQFVASWCEEGKSALFDFKRF
jgi:hypothetical protein